MEPLVDSTEQSEYEYMKEPIETDFLCYLCKNPSCDPVVTDCGHYFCKTCLLGPDYDGTWQYDVCRLCGKTWNVETLNELKGPKYNAVRNILTRVKVKCKTCNAVMERGLKGENIDDHLFTKCPSYCKLGCKVLLTRDQISEHETKCPLFKIPCSGKDLGCDKFQQRMSIQLHEVSCAKAQLAPIITIMKQQFNKLETNVNSLEQEYDFDQKVIMPQLDGMLKAICRETLPYIEDKLNELKDRVDELSEQQNTNNNSELQQDKKKQKKRILDLVEMIDNVSKTVSIITDRVYSTSENVSEIQNLRDTVSGLSKSMVTCQDKIQNTEGRIDDVLNKSSKVGVIVASFMQKVVRLEEREQRHTERIAHLAERTESLGTRTTDISNTVTALAERIAQLENQTVLNLANRISQLEAQQQHVPIGTIVPYGGNNVPANYLECNGQTCSRAIYPVLFATIGTTYGIQGNSFQVPDLRGRTVTRHDTIDLKYIIRAL